MERKQQIKAWRKLNMSYRLIGEKLNISRQRVQQIEQDLNRNRPYLTTGRDRNREKARKRDKYTCQDCKKVWIVGARRFDVHHLKGLCGKKSKGYDSVSDIKKLITLCHKCHFNRPEHKTKKG